MFKGQKKYRKHKSKSFNRVFTSNGKTMLLSKCATCGAKKPRFIKKKEAKGILSSLGLKIPSSKIPLLGDILF